MGEIAEAHPDGFAQAIGERIQAAASSALSPWADPENDDWRDAAADQVRDAVLAELGVVEVEGGRRWCPEHIGGWLNGDACERCRSCSVWVVLDPHSGRTEGQA